MCPSVCRYLGVQGELFQRGGGRKGQRKGQATASPPFPAGSGGRWSVEGVKWEQPGSTEGVARVAASASGGGGAGEVPEKVGSRGKDQEEQGGEVSSVPVLIWESESWEDKFERLPAGSAESREGKAIPEGSWPGGLGGACGRAGHWLRTERESVLVLSGGREAPLVGNREVSFLGMLTPRDRST